jgi:hypothetical protein
MLTRQLFARVGTVLCAFCALGAATAWATTFPLTFTIAPANSLDITINLGELGSQTQSTAVSGTFRVDLTTTFAPGTLAANVSAMTFVPQNPRPVSPNLPIPGPISFGNLHYLLPLEGGDLDVLANNVKGDLKSAAEYTDNLVPLPVTGTSFPVVGNAGVFNAGTIDAYPDADPTQHFEGAPYDLGGASGNPMEGNLMQKPGGPANGAITVTAAGVTGNHRNYNVALSLPVYYIASVPELGSVTFSGDGTLTASSSFFLTGMAGDANVDGSVDGSDLNAVLSNYNLTGMSWGQGDFNGDHTVDGSDLNTVLSNYNSTGWAASMAVAVPEPASIVLLATLATMAAWMIRRRGS